MQTYRRIVISVGVVACGFTALAFAQMMPYTPPAGGGTGGAPSSGSGSTSGGSTGGSSAESTTGGGGSTAGGETVTGSSAGGTAPADSSQTQSNQSLESDSYAADFQDEVERINTAKKPPKLKKKFPGFLTVGNGREIIRNAFTGSARDANWLVGGTATDPMVQGTLTGKGSVWNIVIGLYTGFVRSTFISKAGNWTALFYSDQGASRRELFTKIFYQEEIMADADGNESTLGILLNGTTIFGNYKSSPLSGSFFIVDVNALPTALPSGALTVPIPQLNGPAIPTKELIDLLTKAGIFIRDMFVTVAHAALRPLTMPQTFDLLRKYKEIGNTMRGIEEKFAAFDFNDPEFDYYAVEDEIQALVDAYDINQQKLDYLITQLGKAWLFVRGGDWLSMGGSASVALMEANVDFVPATLFSEISGPFDFYSIKETPTSPAALLGQVLDSFGVKDSGKKYVIFGTCTGKNDMTTGEQVVCTLRKPTSVQSKAVLKANGLYNDLAEEALVALRAIEYSLFAPAE